MTTDPKTARSAAAAALGSARSPAKTAAARRNGAKGGRPRIRPTEDECYCSGCGEIMRRDEGGVDAVAGRMCSECYADVRSEED